MNQFAVDSVEAQISDNIASNQLAEVLNTLLMQALRPIVVETSLVECALASILNPIYSDHRRKLSVIPKADLVDNVFTILAAPDKETKWDCIKRSRMERSVWFNIISLFHKQCETYLRLERKYLKAVGSRKMTLSGKMHRIEVVLGANRSRLSAALRWSKSYFDLYNQFKSRVSEKYVRFAKQQSNKAAEATGLNVDKDELFSNLVLAIDKAISKFDEKKGTLTSSVNNWFMNAKTNSRQGHEYGTSYGVSTTKRRRMSQDYSSGHTSDTNLSVSLDNAMEASDDRPTIESALIQGEENSALVTLANHAKNTRVARLLLGLPYTLTPEDRKKFRKVAVG